MCHAACLFCHAVTDPNFTFLELCPTIGYPSAWIPQQKRKEESSWSECPVTLDPSYLINCPNDIVAIDAVAMDNEKCGLDFWGWSQTKFNCHFVVLITRCRHMIISPTLRGVGFGCYVWTSFYWTLLFILMFTAPRRWLLSWVKWIWSSPILLLEAPFQRYLPFYARSLKPFLFFRVSHRTPMIKNSGIKHNSDILCWSWYLTAVFHLVLTHLRNCLALKTCRPETWSVAVSWLSWAGLLGT